MYYSERDSARRKPIPTGPHFPSEPYRTDWRRDCARIIHSPSFRRLQGKTQLFPGRESDFFRNRLTHSLEVAQIAKSITMKLNDELKKAKEKYYIDPDLVEFASLAHDLGHPPFGHFGEEILDEKMRAYGGFEGNAQTLRILSTTEKRPPVPKPNSGINNEGEDIRIGLNLCARSLASVLKYDREIPFSAVERDGEEGPIKGYYKTEKKVVDFIKNEICGSKDYGEKFATIECQIMDIADDIAYSTYDLEDSFKGGFLSPIDLFCASESVITSVKKKVNKKLGTSLSCKEVYGSIKVFLLSNLFGAPEFDVEGSLGSVPATKEEFDKAMPLIHELFLNYSYDLSKNFAGNSYFRTRFTSRMVRSAIDCVKITSINTQIPALSKVELDKEKQIEIEILKNIVFESQILSPKIQIDAYRSKEVIAKIFDTLIDEGRSGYMFLPEDFRLIYQAVQTEKDKKRIICDFVAGMTDRYALEFYGRLTSEHPQTIFKPL